jgi:hypothetical protein
MTEIVSARWVRLAGLAGVVLVVWSMLVPSTLPWTAAAIVSVAVSVAVWMARSSTPSVAQVIAGVEAERGRAGAGRRNA